MDDTESTNPAEGEDTSAEPETQEVETELDDDGNPIEDQAEEDEEEVDLDDLKLKLPKSQAEKLRQAALRQADYTRKTQEVAELRKVTQAERNDLHQATKAELDAYAAATSTQQRLQQLGSMDWNALRQQARAIDAQNFDREQMDRVDEAFQQYTLLKDQHQMALAQLNGLTQQRLSKGQLTQAKAIEDGRAVLAREIPSWNDGLKDKLITFASEFGFSRDELDDLEADPRVAKVLHAAFEGRDLRRKATKTQAIQKQQEVVPAAKATRSNPPPAGLSDKLSGEEWQRRRAAQLKARA